eukprot:6130334-Amphidinium_carterae.4
MLAAVSLQGHLCIFMEHCEYGDVYTYMREAKQARQQRKMYVQTVQIMRRIAQSNHLLLSLSLSICTFSLAGQSRAPWRGIAREKTTNNTSDDFGAKQCEFWTIGWCLCSSLFNNCVCWRPGSYLMSGYCSSGSFRQCSH